METRRNQLVVSWLTRNTMIEHSQIPDHLIHLLASFSLGVDAWDSTTTHPSIDIDGQLIKTGDIGLRYRMAFGSERIEAPLARKWVLSVPTTSDIPRPVWSIIGIVQWDKAVDIKGIFHNQRNNGYGMKGVNGSLSAS